MTNPTPDDPIDRIAPTLRPERRCIMYQTWRHLLFLHWEVAADALRALLPPGLELDTFEGRAHVGLIPFTMTGVRPPFLPAIPGFSDSHEVNVRTYVHREGRDPGVWFFSLDANHAAAVLGARWVFKLNYYLARMRLEVDGAARAIRFASDRRLAGPRPASCRISYAPLGTPEPARPGTRDFFLIERYLLYAFDGRRLFRGQIHHRPYPLQPAEVGTLEESLVAAAGLTRPDASPLAHYAREVHVEIFPEDRVG